MGGKARARCRPLPWPWDSRPHPPVLSTGAFAWLGCAHCSLEYANSNTLCTFQILQAPTKLLSIQSLIKEHSLRGKKIPAEVPYQEDELDEESEDEMDVTTYDKEASACLSVAH